VAAMLPAVMKVCRGTISVLGVTMTTAKHRGSAFQ